MQIIPELAVEYKHATFRNLINSIHTEDVLETTRLLAGRFTTGAAGSESAHS